MMQEEEIAQNPVISHAMENYLKAIYQLSTASNKVSTSQLAKRMECTPASVTNMLQKLASLRLVEYTRYHGVRLTPAGKKVALEVVRHHRLLELYLADVLGFSWDKVHAEAEQLEHVISEELEARIDEALGFPTRDPHGDPIPTKEGTISGEILGSLWDASAGDQVMVKRVSDRSPEVLRYLASIEIYPEVELEVLGRGPINGPLHVNVGGRKHSLSKELAAQIFVAVR
ncbi:MAG TPA: metal-dependent transcriptional regulator [Acidobacteriota bacterium]|nr:metal-dependent transcriptional regulator [Acidobacteriota bacterium]